MQKKAIDIVLLPSDDVMELCIKVGNEAHQRGEIWFPKSKTERIPHISILMGCMDESKFEKVKEKTKTVSKKISPLNLELDGIEEHWFTVNRTEEIVNLQNELLEHVNPLFTQDCPLTSLLEDDDYVINDQTKIYVNTFLEDSIKENFNPHISIHNFNISGISFPIPFIARRLAICHMGDRGSCRKILTEFELK